MTQCEMILGHMRDHGGITQLDAYHYGITRLAARISNLRDRGYRIRSEMESGKNQFGKDVRYAVYRLEE